MRATVVSYVDDHAGTCDKYLFNLSVVGTPFRAVEDVEPFVNVLPGVAAVVGADHAVVCRTDIDGTIPASNGGDIKVLDAATNVAAAPGVTVIEGEVKSGVTYGVETDTAALKQVDVPDDLGAGDMFPFGVGI